LPNLVVFELDTTGYVDVDVFNAARRVNVVIDVEGWLQ
jgi:hypothetical protein